MTGEGPVLSILQLLSHARIRSGGAMQAWLLSRELARRGHRVTCAMAERDGADPATRRSIEAIGCAYAGVASKGRHSVAALADLLRAGRFDVVHVHREKALALFLDAVRQLDEPPGAIGNVGTSKPPERRHARRLNHRAIDRIVVVAEALKRVLVRAAAVDPARVEVVPGAFDEHAFRADVAPLDRAADLGLPRDAKLVVLVANVDSKKGYDVFLRAARRVAAARADAYFLCAGARDGEAFDRLAADAEVPRDRVRHLGYRDDVPRLLRAADVSVSASIRGEGMTGAIRESLVMATPVVCTALAGNVEIVRHRETGLLVPAGDDAALAAAILETLARPDEARARALRGAQEVRARLTSAARAARIESIYRDVALYRRVRRMPLDDILFPPIEG